MIVAALGLFVLSTFLVGSAYYRNGQYALVRPEFYLLLSNYAYSTFGFLGHTFLTYNAKFLAIKYSFETMIVSYSYCVSTMLAIFLGGKLYQRRERVFLRPPYTKHIAIAAFLFCCLALLLNFVLYYKAGFFSGQMSHVGFMEERRESDFIRIYLFLILPSFALLSLYEKKAWTSLFVFFTFVTLNLAGGSRRVALYMLIIYLAARILRGKRFRYKNLLIIFTISLVLGLAAGLWRSEMNFSRIGEGTSIFDQALLVLTEFSRPYTSLLYYIEHPEPLLWGESFLTAIQMAVPSFLAPYTKAPSLGSQFAQEITDVVGWGRDTGLGFSPTAELFLNFPLPFMFLFFYLFAASIRMFSFRLQKTNWAFISVWLCTAMYTIGRGGFQNVISFTLWSMIFGIMVLFCANIIKGCKQGNSLRQTA